MQLRFQILSDCMIPHELHIKCLAIILLITDRIIQWFYLIIPAEWSVELGGNGSPELQERFYR